jgi:hypothetical protein
MAFDRLRTRLDERTTSTKGLRSLCAHIYLPSSYSIVGINTQHLTTLALAGAGVQLSPLGYSHSTLPQLERLALYLYMPTQSDVALILLILESAVRLTEFALRVNDDDRAWL